MEERIIAERILTCVDRPRLKVTVRLRVPKLNRRTQDYACTFQIVGAGIRLTRSVCGLDTVQALQLALKTAGAEILRIETTLGLHLTFSDLPDSGLL